MGNKSSGPIYLTWLALGFIAALMIFGGLTNDEAGAYYWSSHIAAFVIGLVVMSGFYAVAQPFRKRRTIHQ